jgi:hypothetical protein
MNEHDPDEGDWPFSRRLFLLSAGVAAGAGALLGGPVLGQEGGDGDGDEDGDDDGNGAGADDSCTEGEETPTPKEFTTEVDNQYFPLPVGRRLVLEGEEDGTTVRLRVTVLDTTETVGEVTTRVVEEREWEDGELIEVSRNYYAQSNAGGVWYFGEAVDIYEDGEIVSHEGAWRAYESGNEPGLFMPADPKVGMQFRQEKAPGIAEDRAIIIGRGETVEVPAGTFENSLRTYDWNTLEPGTPGDVKVYALDLGIIVDGPVELVEFTR